MGNRPFLAEGSVQHAAFALPPSFAQRRPPKRGRKAEGLRFEAKAQAYLAGKSLLYLPSPWIRYLVDGKACWCQPDGLHFDLQRGRLTIVEIKYSHTAEAHRQLRGVYAQVIARMFPAHLWAVRLVEVVKWYDPDVRFPEATVSCSDPFKHDSTAIGVHIWRP